ncbi:uncharacterized protein LOC120932922 isoform X2 [Rana temporaria]|uniref:uncharacterized protein LOC120932922 isoform X2 n=1 Tax=Rana temporaria TaxID=8407 RepID=UPI001AADE7FE|nr:uncharacterized protein LOC120932922 isoform X2 [Rana temporaria]
MPAPLSLLSLLGAGSQGVVVAGGTHAAENLKLVVRRLQGECFRGSCLFHRCMKTFPHLLTDSTSSQTREARRGICRKPRLLHLVTVTSIKRKSSGPKRLKRQAYFYFIEES